MNGVLSWADELRVFSGNCLLQKLRFNTIWIWSTKKIILHLKKIWPSLPSAKVDCNRIFGLELLFYFDVLKWCPFFLECVDLLLLLHLQFALFLFTEQWNDSQPFINDIRLNKKMHANNRFVTSSQQHSIADIKPFLRFLQSCMACFQTHFPFQYCWNVRRKWAF